MCADNSIKKPETITGETIARLAGVSTATVSRALSGVKKDGKYVTRPETLKKIKQVCKELNYKPNILARAFTTQKSKTIAAVGYANETYFFRRLAEAQNVAFAKGYNLNINMLSRHESIDLQFERMFQMWKYDGVWMVGSSPPVQERLIHYCADHKVPLLFTGQPIACDDAPNVKCVGADIQKGFTDLINYLYFQGHRKFIWLIPNLDTDALAKMYYQDIQNALKERKIPKENVYIVQTTLDNNETLEITKSYFERLRTSVEPADFPTVAIAIWTTIGTLHGIQEAGLRVPEDISFVTLDYSIEEFGSSLRPPVAALFEPQVASAEKSISYLIQMIKRADKQKEQPFEYIPLDMIFRENESCKSVREMEQGSSKS